MSQRNCGCSDLVTPTVEELLAFANKKPLPKIRDRTPPRAKVGATFQGWMEWRLIDRQGREVKGGEGPNLILNQGLDLITTTRIMLFVQPLIETDFPLIRYCAVGTDNTTPAATQTGLGAEIGRTSTTYSLDTTARPSDGVYQFTRHIEFDYNQANGNLTEWGFSPTSTPGSNLFNRALFVDGVGDPDPVTKTSDFKLRIIYTLQITVSPTDWTVGSFDITNIGTINGQYRLIGGSAGHVRSDPCNAPDVNAFNILAMTAGAGTVSGIGELPVAGSLISWPSDLSATAYTFNTEYTGDVTNKRVARALTNRDSYVSGSFQRTGGSWTFDTGFANLNPIRSFRLTGMAVVWDSGFEECTKTGYIFDLDEIDEFSKDDEHRLIIGMPDVTWGRDT